MSSIPESYVTNPHNVSFPIRVLIEITSPRIYVDNVWSAYKQKIILYIYI